MVDGFAALEAADPAIADVIAREVERQNTTIQLIASENFTSPAVLAAQGSVLTNKYSEGYPGKRYYGGNVVVDEAEELARTRACALFGAEHANVQPHSGANANMAVYLGLFAPGDKLMGMRLDQGGHLTHGSPVNFSGRLYEFVAYGVDDETETLDYDRIRDTAKAERPKAIIAGATAYPRIIDFAAFRSIADEIDALLIVDAAHIAGLIAGGAHPSPVPYADVVTFTTHKTLRGPRAGAILCRQEHAAAIDKAVFPGLQGGPLMHVIAAKAVAFHLAAQPDFRDYAAQIVTNARSLAGGLADEGFRIVSGGTDNHLMLVDLRPFGVTGKVAQEALDRAGITCNKNAIPNDPEKPFVTSGLRLGTASVTTAGMGEPEMAEVAGLMASVLRAPDDGDVARDVRDAANRLCAKFTPYPELAAGRQERPVEGYAVVFAIAALTTLLLTPLVRRLAIRAGAIVQPNPRGVHTTAVPTLGGAAMFVGFLVAMGVASRIPQFHEMFDNSTDPAGVMIGAAVMFAVGALDDLRDVSPPAKIAGMVLAGGLMSLFGVQMLFFRIPFVGPDTLVLSADLAPLVTVIVVVVFANAINLIDGLDGLAAGIVVIAGTALFLYSDRLFKGGFLEGSNVAPLIAVIAVGICIGFLPFNFNPARIFMGDAGALFLGLLLATTTIMVGGRADYQYTGNTYFFYAPLFIPIVILGVPILDTAFSFVRRVARGRSFAVADKDHLHHRLMRMGHGPRRTVVILWLWTALLSGLALLPAYTKQGNALVPVGVLALALLLYALFFPGRQPVPAEPAVAEPVPEPEPLGEVVDLDSRRRGTG